MRRGPARRRGFFLPLLLVVASVILLLAMQRLFFARNTLLFTVHLARHEVAYQAALGGLKCGRALFASLVDLLNDGGRADDLPPGLSAFAAKFRDPAGGIRIAECDAALASPNFAALEKASGAKLEVRATVDRVAAIEGSPRGADGPEEMVFRLRVSSTALFEGSRVSLAYVTEGRRVLTHLPLLSKFTLHVKEPGEFRVNAVNDSEDAEKVKRFPLTLEHGRTLRPGETLKGEELSALLDAQGFVYLGGDAGWRLGLGTIGRDPRLEDAGIVRDLYLYDVGAGLFPNSEAFQFYARASGLFRESRTPEGREFMALASNDEAVLSSLLHLHGGSGAPSPAFVAGQASACRLLEQGITRPDMDLRAAFPYLPDEETFRSKRWPGGNSDAVVSLVHDAIFAGDYEAYRERMSRPVREQYNRVLHAYLKRSALPPELHDVMELPDGTLPPLARLKINDIAAKPDLLHKPAGRVTLLSEKGETVYQGGFEGPDLAAFLGPRVCYLHKSGKDFHAARGGDGRIAIQGIERVAGDLAIGEGFRLAPESFGLLVVDGDIRIGAPIPASAGHLYLVSLGGDIAVETGGPVNAYLAAPKGTVTLPDGVEIRGGLAASRLTARFLPDGRNVRKLAYDPRFDVTDDGVRAKGFKVVVRRTWDFLVEPGGGN